MARENQLSDLEQQEEFQPQMKTAQQVLGLQNPDSSVKTRDQEVTQESGPSASSIKGNCSLIQKGPLILTRSLQPVKDPGKYSVVGFQWADAWSLTSSPASIQPCLT